MRQLLTLLLVLVLCTASIASTPDDKSGQVQLPLEEYRHLIEALADPSPRPAPAAYALGSASVAVGVTDVASRATGTIQVRLIVEVLEDQWVLVPVLPAGTPVESVKVGGKPVQLIATPHGLAWSTRKSGSYTMDLAYRVDARRSGRGFTLPVPIPEAAAINLTATLPGTGLDVAVIPGTGVQTHASGNTTRLTATLPTTSGVQISWRSLAESGHAISRAAYSGRLSGDAVIWTGELQVELFDDEVATLQLLPKSVTLSELKVDGKEASILVEGNRFATRIKGRGLHQVVIGFQVAVTRRDGPPRIDLAIPQIPVSRFDLTLPGKKDLTVTPASNVTTKHGEDSSTSTVHVPMTEHVSFSWSEAVPEEVRTVVRSHATAYHTVHAAEGVLYVRARIVYEVTRGETNVIELELPPGVQINRIEAPSGAVADWRIARPKTDGPRVVSVFLDRQLEGRLLFDVLYDVSLGRDEEPIRIPLIRALQADRQRGMIALLANSDLTLNPIEEVEATKVGENQLPAFVREATKMTVAHTYKYTDALPRLVVTASEPERVQGKFDAQVDTLVSLGDVTLTATASVGINVKFGTIMALQLELPPGVNLLNLTAPSLRTHKVNPGADGQLVDVEFTQEMEGQFRLELTYERILVDGEETVEVPTLSVREAEVEQGRIAVEALSAVEVRTAAAEQLSALEITELPRQLVLRTTNPILLAYKYIHAETPYRLALEVKRHDVVGVQEAAIDRADYSTLFTTDGLMVTTARFHVRNSRKQFLRVRLPEGAEVWSAFVDGKPEKPALARDENGEDAGSVLIKIINSTEGFPVQLIYAVSGRGLGRLGRIEGTLPRPDILVTSSRWDVYLPHDLRYAEPSTDMDLIESAMPVSAREIDAKMAALEEGVGMALRPLRITVPTAGVHFAFEKLYANQADRASWFRVAYASPAGAAVGRAINLAGVLLLWLGIGLYLFKDPRPATAIAAGISAGGALILAVTIGMYGMSATLPLVLSLVIAALFLLVSGRRHLGQWGRQTRTADQG